MSITFGPGVSLGPGVQVIIPAPPRNLWAWGKNSDGQLGLGDVVNRSSPVQVGALGTWAQLGGIKKGNLTQAVKTDGTLWAWGLNSVGQLGLGDIVNRSSPVQVGILTNWDNSLTNSGGTQTVSMLKSDGTAWIAGNSSWIFNTTFGTNRSSPVQVGSDKTWAVAVVTRTLGWAGITTGGTLWSSEGDNRYGSSGQNNTANTSSPAQVGALTDWAGLYPGYYGTLARKTDGTLWSWGRGDNTASKAFLGQNNGVNRSSPTQIGSLTTWAKVFAYGMSSAAAIKIDGTLWAWGRNNFGQLGLGDVIDRSSPVQVGILTNWLSTAGKFSAGQTEFAVNGNGSLWAWGRNYWGTLGNNNGSSGPPNYTYISRSSPMQVGLLTTWTSVWTNYNAVIAIAGH